MSDEPGAAGEQQRELLSRLRAVVDAKDAENAVLRQESAAAIACSQSTSWPAIMVAGACGRCRMTQHSGCGSTPRSPGPGFGMCAADPGPAGQPVTISDNHP
jgi:hypothetical protein